MGFTTNLSGHVDTSKFRINILFRSYVTHGIGYSSHMLSTCQVGT